jgi:hypothetical protein
MTPTSTHSRRRFIAIGTFVVAAVLVPVSLFWSVTRMPAFEGEMYPSLGVSFVALVCGITTLLTARSRWRWLLLLLLLPLSMAFCEDAWNAGFWTVPTGIFPYFLYLIPSAVLSSALWTFVRWFTGSWNPASSLFCWQNIARAGLHALPFAIMFAPMWLTKPGISFMIPAATFLFVPGFGGFFDGRSTDREGMLMAATSLGVVWTLLTPFFLRISPRALTEEMK